MRILALGKYYPPPHGGIETLLRSWCEGFAGLGAEVDCVVANHRARTEHQVVNGVRVHRYASYGTALSTAICPRFLRATRKYSADIWHVHFPNPLADLTVLLGSKKVPMVLTYHSDIIRQASVMKVYRPVLEALLRRATKIVVATPKHFEYSPWLGPYESKVDVIPFGIDLKRFETRETGFEDRIAELRNSAQGQTIFLNIGRLVGYKGQKVLLDAFRGVEGVLWLVGSGPLEKSLKQQAQDLGIADRVKFWGSLGDGELTRLLHACDVFVFPSITPNEAFGLVQVEAMACSKPVISCSLKSGVPYVNQDGVTGLIVPPGDVAALRGAMNRFQSEPELRNRLGAAGRVRAYREFDEPVMVARYYRYFEQLLGRV